MFIALITLAILVLATASPTFASSQVVEIWLTTANEVKLLHREPDLVFGTDVESAVTINVNERQTYQTIDGFGAAVTGSAAYLIHQKLSPDQRANLLNDLFGSDGIGLSVVRHSIGASDFSLHSYTYNDTPGNVADFEFQHFSVDADREDVIPILQAILGVNPNIQVMGSPWTAPAWLKERPTLNGSRLKQDPRYYSAYANYFVKYIEAFAAAGIPIHAVTVQNEPLHVSGSYPTMRMSDTEQRDFIRDHLGPAFREHGIATKIIAYDHNWDRTDYPQTILADSQASQYIDGIAWHCYAGVPEAMSDVQSAYPDKNVYFTECSGGEWAKNFRDNLRWNMSNLIIGATRNWARTVLLWNIALDPQHGPTNRGCLNCRGVVTIDPMTGQVTKNVEYYVLGHASQFVQPGSVRIESNSFVGRLENVAFRNPDGSIVLIVLNNWNSQQTFTVRWGSVAFTYVMPAAAVVTFVWGN